MEFGILFTSHSNIDVEPYPHGDVHARVTREIMRADELGFDYAWVAEHHFPARAAPAARACAMLCQTRIGVAGISM
jgi:alkanesulfonate monooxygenase SsuD/methylene tetrahydromethanopterin reductase-like flavin-dependent oxidoreductase (luciferase family)